LDLILIMTKEVKKQLKQDMTTKKRQNSRKKFGAIGRSK
jgi:hypothetical protein